jgi:hypothetical protein
LTYSECLKAVLRTFQGSGLRAYSLVSAFDVNSSSVLCGHSDLPLNVGVVCKLSFGLDRLVKPAFHDTQNLFVVLVELHAVLVGEIEVEETIGLHGIEETRLFFAILVQKLGETYGT